jgi:N-methylhydantoinase A
VTSALGCVVADMRHDRVQTVNRLLDEVDTAAMGAEMAGVAEETEALVLASGVSFASVDRLYEFDMLYLGQTHTLTVPVEIPDDRLDRETVQTAFDAAYRAAYGRLLEAIPVRMMNYRVSVIGRRPDFDMGLFAPGDGAPAEDCQIGERSVYADGRYWTAPLYDRLALSAGARVEGPALLEQSDATVFIDPGLEGRVDALGNLVIAPIESQA